MRTFNTNPNVDNSDLVNYPDGRIKDNTGSGDGTGVNEQVYGDLHQAVAKAMRLYGIIPNGLPENENPLNGFQIIEALRALASKNDFILPITTSSGVLEVSIKLSYMLNDEQVVCKASVAITTETQIKGLDNVTFTITKIGDFKVGEYVRLVKTSSSVVLIRLADATSLDLMVGDFSYLKKASQAEEDAGIIETAATTPKSNLTTFVKRINDNTLSLPYLATTSKNGLYPKAHFDIVAAIGANPIRNVGGFGVLDVGGSVGALTAFGDIAPNPMASIFAPGESLVVVNFNNAMDNTNYFLTISLEAVAFSGYDNDILTPVYQIMSETQVKIYFQELLGSSVQNLKVNIQAIQR
jgi:hypothetical protein